MSFSIGDILFFDRYLFTDTGQTKRHFALALLPEHVTQYQENIFCCVITSKETRSWSLALLKTDYKCFSADSFVCFNRKDLVPKDGLGELPQPRGELNKRDLNKSYKLLKKSLFVIKDICSDPFLRGTIIYRWKKVLGKT